MRIRCLTVTAITILWGASLSVFAQRAGQPYQKWEYKIVNFCKEEDRQADIHKLGEDGWELASTDVGISGEGAGSCQTYYFKRPLREGAKQTAQASNVAKPSIKPNAPQCSLPLENAPTIRGLRLGMNLEEFSALFPGWAANDYLRNQIKKAEKPPGYGAFQLFLHFSSGQAKANVTIFDGIDNFTVTFFDGKVGEFTVQYSFAAEPSISWTTDSWIAMIGGTFGLPDIKSWSGKDETQILCDGFEVKTRISTFPDYNNKTVRFERSSPRLTITNSSFRQIIEKRIKDDQEKNRRAFKF